jgi:RNA polymerase sigma-70 factor (ECF subfamily)
LDAFQRELIDLLPRLRRFARSLARDAADADDLVQTALERALARRASFAAGTRLDSWMFTILRNAWIDETRARARRGRMAGAPQEAAAVADPRSPDLDARLVATAVERALAALPEDQRTAVFLVLVEGLSYAEAALVIGAPVGTLTSRLARGRTTLMRQLEEPGARSDDR